CRSRTSSSESSSWARRPVVGRISLAPARSLEYQPPRVSMKSRIASALPLLLLSVALARTALSQGSAQAAPPAGPPPLDPREVHLADLVQLTFQGENAEAYWSPDSR